MNTEAANKKDILNFNTTSNNHNNETTTTNLLDNYNDKIPNYLNLACCVNGYSNLTTYDSKIRQDINKSREVSPIRPSTSALQYCKQSNLLTPPTLHSLQDIEKQTKTIENINNNNNNNNNAREFNRSYVSTDEEACQNQKHQQLSFIQQRVELLYGREALSHVFYTPNKGRKSTERAKTVELESNNDLMLQYNKYQLPTTKASSKGSLAKTHNGYIPHMSLDETDCAAIDLPVFRHLSAEFRSQLPKLSPKRQIPASINQSNNNNNNNTSNGNCKMDCTDDSNQTSGSRPLSGSISPINNMSEERSRIVHSVSPTLLKSNATNGANDTPKIKDGHYFLTILKGEQERLLVLADEAEEIINELREREDISEDTMGLLRSASGKARLLVTQKMKQFEGLCKDNVKPPTGNKFQTTTDDLLGFWDMVKLQVDHVDSMFEEITALKQSNWQQTALNLEIKSTPNLRQPKTPGRAFNKDANTPMSAAAQKREQQRKQLLEMKRKNKLAMATNKSSECVQADAAEEASSIKIFVNNSNTHTTTTTTST